MKRGALMFGIFLAFAPSVYAYAPFLVSQTSLHDITEIIQPEDEHYFYGQLNDFPHTYEIRSTEPFHLYVEVRVPDMEDAKNTVSGIIIKEDDKTHRVREITRLLARDASWDSVYESIGADSYRRGGTFESDLESGVYRIEVSTPDNKEKYVLVVGKEENETVNYFEKVARVIEVKHFYGRSRFWAILSPLVYVPLLSIGFLCLAFFFVRYMRTRTRTLL